MAFQKARIVFQAAEIKDVLLQPGMLHLQSAAAKADDFSVSRMLQQLMETLAAYQARSAEK